VLANCGWPHCVSHTASHYLYSVLLQKLIRNGAASTFTCGIPPIEATNSTQGFVFRKRNSKSRSQQLHIVMWKNERKKVQGPGTNARLHIPKWICPLTSLECIPHCKKPGSAEFWPGQGSIDDGFQTCRNLRCTVGQGLATQTWAAKKATGVTWSMFKTFQNDLPRPRMIIFRFFQLKVRNFVYWPQVSAYWNGPAIHTA